MAGKVKALKTYEVRISDSDPWEIMQLTENEYDEWLAEGFSIRTSRYSPSKLAAKRKDRKAKADRVNEATGREEGDHAGFMRRLEDAIKRADAMADIIRVHAISVVRFKDGPNTYRIIWSKEVDPAIHIVVHETVVHKSH